MKLILLPGILKGCPKSMLSYAKQLSRLTALGSWGYPRECFEFTTPPPRPCTLIKGYLHLDISSPGQRIPTGHTSENSQEHCLFLEKSGMN